MIIKKSIYILFLFLISFLSLAMGQAAKKEFRGVWIRPPSTEKEIIEVLDNLQKAHMNVVFVETFYNGHTIYPGKVFEIRANLQGKDLLKIFVEEGHKRGLEIHCWLHTFYWRPVINNQIYPMAQLEKHPEWLDQNRDGKLTREYEKGYDFVNPAIPEVRELIQKLIKEIISQYAVDGIHLDYVRYASNGDAYGFGYNPYAVKKFKNKYKINPLILTPEETPQTWELWCRFREDQVTEAIQSFSKVARETRKNIQVSAAVFPDYYGQRFHNSKMQNYTDWCQSGALDFLTPMCYSYSPEGILKEIRMAKEFAGDTPIYPGLAARKGTPHPDFPEQIELVRKENPAGHSLFSYGWMMTYPGLIDKLATEIYSP